MQARAGINSSTDVLLLGLYGSCTDPMGWRNVLDLLGAQMSVGSVVLQEFQFDEQGPEAIWVAHDSLTDLTEYHTKISDARNPRLRARPIPSVVCRLVDDDDLFSSDQHSIKRRFQAQLSQIGFGRFLGGMVSLGNGRYMTLALHRRVGDGKEFSERQRTYLSALLPHFGQALQLTRAVAANRCADALLRGHLDRWTCGLVVCDSAGLVLWLNQRASSELSCGRGQQLHENRFLAPNSEVRLRLTEALRRQVASAGPNFLVLDSGSLRWQLALQTLDRSTASESPLLLVTLTRDEPAGLLPVESLVALFGLTEAEARLASAFISGITLEKYAQKKGVRLGTVRYQLKQVLAKSGARRQADLVRKVLCSAAAYAVGADSLNLDMTSSRASTCRHRMALN